MQLSTAIVTTKTHTAVFTADEIKNVALNAAKREAGVTDVVSSTAAVALDGSITIELVEQVGAPAADAAAAPDTAPAKDGSGADTPAPVIPPAAPLVVPGFGAAKAA